MTEKYPIKITIGPDQNYENYSFDEFSITNFNDVKVNTTLKNKVSQLFEKLYTHFNFREILKENREQNFFIKQKFSNPPTNEHITAYDGDAIRRCMKLILNIDNFQKYKSYMQYQIIKNYYGFCVKELDDEFFEAKISQNQMKKDP